MNEKKKKNNIKNTVSNNLFMLKYVFKFAPGLIIYMVILKILTAFSDVIRVVYTLKYILDAFQNHTPVIKIITFLLGYTIFSVILLLLTFVYQEIYYPKYKVILAQKMQMELYKKAVSIDLASYDNPTFYNDFIWAMSQSETKALQVLESVGIFIQNVTAVVSVVTIIFTLDPLGIIFVIVSCLVNLLLTFKINKIKYKQDMQSIKYQRRRDYTNRVFYQLDYIKEVRLSNIEHKLISDFKINNIKLIGIIKKFAKKLVLINISCCLFSSDIFFNGLYMVIIVFKSLVLHTISFGAVVGLLNGTTSLQESITNLIQQVPQFTQYSIYIEKFRKFLNYESKVNNKDSALGIPDNKCIIELKNVGFTYESNQKPTLQNINMTIKPGEKIALVGYNGAGKSTLIKLILRLYDVSNGSICLDNENIKNYNLKQYREMYGVIFQDFQLFSANIAENVEMDVIGSNLDRVHNALKQSGFQQKLEHLEDGIYTPLTREFSKKGVNLSGGESQKLAIARVFAKDCQYYILDEPSSALDPESEYEINQKMLSESNDKTVIFISHRLSTTVMADKIYMLENGTIIEEGNHIELMKLNGKYAEMFHMQSEKYLNNVV